MRAPAICAEGLGKCYRSGKRGKLVTSGDRWNALLELLGLERFVRRQDPMGKKKKTKKVGEVWALNDVSFEVEEGCVLGIVGRNGAGKTTLLKVLARITSPTTGRATIRGRVVPLLEIGTGFNPTLSGRENIFLNAAIFGLKRRDVTRRLDEIIAFAELGDFVDTPLRYYSSGMYLRLAFSAAIHMDAQIILADEVLAVADIGFQDRCMRRMAEEGRAGRTILFVSHDMESILRLASRAIRIDHGRIVDDGRPVEVVSRYQNAMLGLGEEGRRRSKGKGAAAEGIVSVQLTSVDGRPIGAMRIWEDACVRIVFTLSPSSPVHVRCGMDLHAGDVHVFRAMQAEESRLEPPGTYQALVRIPGNLLAETVYRANVSVNVRAEEGEQVHVEYDALSFHVYDTDEAISSRGTYVGRLPGVISPRLDWQVGPIVEPSAAASGKGGRGG